MLAVLVDSNGRMAQFNHPEFGGYGQWMSGGMTMVSDMFNNHLKGRVDSLCGELAGLVARQPGLHQAGNFQSRNQGGQYQGGFAGGPAPIGGDGPGLFVAAPGGGGNWWPGDLGWPNSTGAQNNSRYAYFAQARRLAVELNGHVTVHDTLDHQIGGFSQQQSQGGSMMFSSQYGLVDVASLPVVSGGVQPRAPFSPPPPPQVPPTWAPVEAPAQTQAAGDGDVFATIEKLAGLRAKGILTDDEFNAKKAELLARI
jgi:hypothetical protein